MNQDCHQSVTTCRCGEAQVSLQRLLTSRLIDCSDSPCTSLLKRLQDCSALVRALEYPTFARDEAADSGFSVPRAKELLPETKVAHAVAFLQTWRTRLAFNTTTIKM